MYLSPLQTTFAEFCLPDMEGIPYSKQPIIDFDTGFIYRGQRRYKKTSSAGYIQLRYKNKLFLAHEIILFWLTSHGFNCPDGLVIDHRDNDKCNNAITNLRLITHAQNIQRAKPQSQTAHQIKGYSYASSMALRKHRIETTLNGRIQRRYFKTKKGASIYAKLYADWLERNIQSTAINLADVFDKLMADGKIHPSETWQTLNQQKERKARENKNT